MDQILTWLDENNADEETPEEAVADEVALATGGVAESTRKAYDFFMRPEPKDVAGDIEVEPETGLRSRKMRIGMVRGAKDEDKHVLQVFLDPIPHIRIDAMRPLQGWYKAKTEPKGVRDRPCFTDAILTQPYGGFCTVGCAFCYINSGFKGYRGSGLVSVPMGYGDQVKKALGKMQTSAAGYFSSFTDPFLPLENYYHNTQHGAQAFVDAGLPIFFLSRLRYPGWAIDMLQKNPYSYAQKSINTANPKDWKKLSPGAASLEEHMDDIRELKKRGIYVSIQVNPILPGVVDHTGVIEIFEMLRAAGADHVIVKFVEAGYSWAPAMVKRIQSRFGDERGKVFESLFTENIGGQKTIAEEYRIVGHRLYQAAAKRLGLTYATCYEYKMVRNEAGEVINKTGVSIGKEFLTADQCHGHRVPMFTRKTPGAPFTEVEECPPTGCLSCSDDNKEEPGKARCGSELYGSAKALRMPDFKIGVYSPPVPAKPKKGLPVLPNG